jgi:UDP-2,3-diacylglucosamine pyrophosphatase LpxH
MSQEKILVFSDIEFGAGGERDDFPHDQFLIELLNNLIEEDFAKKNERIHLVFNGDTFDLLKTPYKGLYPHIVNEAIACEKMGAVQRAHEEFFVGLHDLLKKYDAKRLHVYFVIGNHDMELLFPKVQEMIRSSCGAEGQRFIFISTELKIGDVWIEHGNMQDPLFYFDPQMPFVSHHGEKILNQPWATVALLNVFMPLQSTLYHLDRIKPKKKLFEIMPELKEWMMGNLWQYWRQDYMKSSADPLKKVSWTMVKEVIKRSAVFNPDLVLGENLRERVQKGVGESRVFVLGHMHEEGLYAYGNRKLMQAGCFRNEYMIEEEGEALFPIVKSYIDIEMQNGRARRSHIREVVGPELPDHYIPRALKDYVPLIQSFLGSYSERYQRKSAIEGQEQKESLVDFIKEKVFPKK